MQDYKNTNRNSSITRYLEGNDFIIVEFAYGHGKSMFYKYTSSSAGQRMISEMILLAKKGSGLGAYIKSHNPSFVLKSISLSELIK